MSPYREQWKASSGDASAETMASSVAFPILVGAISMASLVVAILYAARWQ